MLLTPTLLVLLTFRLLLLLIVAWLFEPGPVVPMLTLPPVLGGVRPARPVPLLTLTLVFVPLVLPAFPLEALPPLVLPETLALPLDALWLFEFVTPILLVLFKLALLLVLTVPLLNDPGPVVFMLTEDDPLPAIPNSARPLLVTPTDAEVLLLLPTPPLMAFPPLVLPETLALPLDAPWLLPLNTPKKLLLFRLALLLVLDAPLLNDPGPVLVITIVPAAAAYPIMPRVAAAITLCLNTVLLNFIELPPQVILDLTLINRPGGIVVKLSKILP